MENENKVVEQTTETKVNLFAESLKRNTSQIKGDRAIEIAELAEIEFKRRVEDLDRDLKTIVRKKKSSLDMSPDNTYSLMKVKDFEPVDFINAYTELGIQEREIHIKLNIAKQAYNELFGQTYEIIPII